MVVGVSREDQPMSERFAFIGVQIGHARRVRRFELGLPETGASEFCESLTRALHDRNLPKEQAMS